MNKWISEMIRIAKPGKPVIAEAVSDHICERSGEMGLVPRTFWKEAVAKYGWDVNPDSIVIENNKALHWRYNVFMRKNSRASAL